MAIGKLTPPDVAFRKLVELRNGYLYWRNIPENQHHTRDLTKPIGSQSSTPRATVRYKGKRYSVNRLTYWMKYNRWPDVVMFNDGDATNYHIDNLKEATAQTHRLASKSNYGVNIIQLKNGDVRYQSRMQIDDETYFIGTYTDELSALFSAWKIRHLLFPDLISIPPKVIDAYLTGKLTITAPVTRYSPGM